MAAILKSNSLRDGLDSFCRSHKLESLCVFGSRADEILKLVPGHGEPPSTQLSDVDIAVKLPPDRELSARQKAEMAYAICSREIGDVLAVRDTFKNWIENHPESIDTAL